jgi:Na+/H+-dicarboxylate symporter
VGAGLALGLAVGISLDAVSHTAASHAVSVAEPVGALWVNGIRMTVIPLVVSMLVVGIAAPDATRGVGRMGIHAAIFFIVTLAAVALFTTFVTPPLFTLLRLDPAAITALRASAASTDPAPTLPSLADWIVSLVPANPVRAAVDGALLPLLFFTVTFSYAVSRVAPERRDAVVEVFRGVADAVMVLVGWVLAVAPLGIFALALTLGVFLGAAALGALGFYVGVVIALHIVVTAALYPLATIGGHIGVRRFARAALPAQVVAFSSRSSFAALPAMLEGATRELRLPQRVSAFVLPLAVSTYRLTSPIYWPVGAMFIARLYGIEFGFPQVATMAFAAVVLTASAPGIPSGGLFIQAPLYATLGLPVEGLAILIAVDAIPDMFKTTLNVTGQMAAAAVLGRGTQEPPPAAEFHPRPSPGTSAPWKAG